MCCTERGLAGTLDDDCEIRLKTWMVTISTPPFTLEVLLDSDEL